MLDDRRSANRSRLSGLRATFESADGVSRQADVFNLSRAGLFLETETQVAVGKRLSLEVHVTGEPIPWAALGRVIWTRASHESAERPCGMGVKLIDVEDTVVAAIERLVDLREETEPGLGEKAKRAHPYDQTILGVGTAPVVEVSRATPSEPLVTPLVTPLAPAPTGSSPTATNGAPRGEEGEPGLAIDLVRRPETEAPAARLDARDEPEPMAAESPTPVPVAPSGRITLAAPIPVAMSMPVAVPTPIPAPVLLPATAPSAPIGTQPRRRGGWIVLAVVVIALAIAAYALRGFLPTG